MNRSLVPKILLGLLLFSLFASSAIALSTDAVSHYNSRVWEVDDGLPHNSVQAIAQTRDGYLWIGTQNGLARFDGVHFKIFDGQNTPGMKSAFISALCEGPDGSLWIGTLNAGLIRRQNENFTFYARKDGLADESIRALFVSRDGAVWIGTTNGAIRFHSDRFESFLPPTGLVNNIVRGFCEDHEGTLLIATDSGLLQWSEGVLSIYQPAEKELPRPGGVTRVVYPDKRSRLWIGSSAGLSCLRDNELVHYDRFQEGLPDSFVISLGEGTDGTLWVGTYDGLGYLVGNRFVTELTSSGETYGQVNALLTDREGNLWAGTKDGLYRLSARPFQTYTRQNGLPNNNVTSVLESKDGSMWFGTWGGGFAQWQPGTNVIADYTAIHAGHTKYGVAFDHALAICEAKDGTLWFGTDFSTGLFHWKSNALSRFAQAEGLNDPAIRVIYEDRQGDLWLGTRTALVLFKEGRFTRFTTNEGLAGNTVRVITEDHNGTLWIGTSDGLSQMKDGKFISNTKRDGLPNNTVIALREDREKTLWIGTSDGLCRMTGETNSRPETRGSQFHSYSTKDGLFSDQIFEILEDDLGHLWMSSPRGIFRVRKKDFEDFDLRKIKDLHCTVYDKADGLATVQCNGVAKPAGWKAKDGRLWFAMTKGVSVVNPNADVNGNLTPPPVVIEEIVLDKQRRTQPFNFSPGRGELEIHYTALSFSESGENRFRYKLEGLDPVWVDAGTRRTAYYNNVPPGDYTFRVVACNNDGAWNSLGTHVEFTLQPHVWQTKWFIGLMGIMAVCLVASTARYVTWKKVQRQLQRLEQRHAIERERTRIAQDMHDDLGARLTEILMINNVAQKSTTLEQSQSSIKNVSTVVRNVVENLDALVWAVNPRNDSLNKLAGYIYEFAGAFLKLADIPCRFDVPSQLPHIPLSSETRHNVFLVVKEALNNIVKYSRATEVQLRLQVLESGLSISITDNGTGFVIEGTSMLGNGLLNMRKRVEGIGGHFEIQSEPGKGTCVRLCIPLPRSP